MTFATDLFTPAPGTAFVFSGVMTVKVDRYDGDSLICHGLNGWDDDHVYEFKVADRADLSQFRVIEEPKEKYCCDECGSSVDSFEDLSCGLCADCYADLSYVPRP